jgi:hypothetical protein
MAAYLSTISTPIADGVPLISRNTWRVVVYATIILVLALLAFWVIRKFKTIFQADDTRKSSNSTTTRPDGTPASVPTNVDLSYVERIAQLVVEIDDEQDYGWYSGKRCEASNNIGIMRPEELAAVSGLLRPRKRIGLGALVARWDDDGCSYIGLAGDIDKIKAKTRNY